MLRYNLFIFFYIISIKKMDIQEKFKTYIELQKEIVAFRKKQTEQKKVLQGLEKEIHEYMQKNNMTTVSLNDGEIVLYEKKVSQSFKRPAMIEKITEELKCSNEKAEGLAESILTNKVFTLEPKIKANIKKSK
jgi:septal ring factor EnvC (AmiA/AmiB activator)